MPATLSSTVSTVERRILDALAAADFTQRSDGWFYPPGEPGRAAVRLAVFEGQYQLARRRRLTSPWMMIAVDGVEHFDIDAFQVWRRSWPLSH